MTSPAIIVGVSIAAAFCLMIVLLVAGYCVYSSKLKTNKNLTFVRPVRRDKQTHKTQRTKMVKPYVESESVSCCCCLGKRSPEFTEELDPPSDIALVVTQSTVRVTWTKSFGSNSTNTEKYQIFKRLSSEPGHWVKVGTVGGSVMEFRVQNLVADTWYHIGVAAKTQTGKSSIVEKPVQIKSKINKPSAPTDLNITDISGDKLTLRWKPPSHDGHVRITSYHVMMTEGKTGSWMTVAKIKAFDRYMEYRVTKLSAFKQYSFKVAAVNKIGEGPFVQTTNPVTIDKDFESPGIPKGPLKYSKITYSSITLSWKPPDHDGGKEVTSYVVEYKDVTRDSKWKKLDVVKVPATTYTVGQLSELTDYVFRVRAMNIIGNGQPLIGAKVRTKLLEIPLAQRSSSRAAYSRAASSRESLNFRQRNSSPGSNHVKFHENCFRMVNGTAGTSADKNKGKFGKLGNSKDSHDKFHDIFNKDIDSAMKGKLRRTHALREIGDTVNVVSEIETHEQSVQTNREADDSNRKWARGSRLGKDDRNVATSDSLDESFGGEFDSLNDESLTNSVAHPSNTKYATSRKWVIHHYYQED